jgi:hypothetical protein
MPDETTATEAQPAAATTTAQAHPTGGAANEPKPDPLPVLDVGADSKHEKWILYLQQMFNYHYGSQVVTEDGHYDSQTGSVVDHFRSQQHLSGGTKTDAEVWEKLGVEDPLEAWKRAHPQGARTGAPPGGAHGAGTQGAGTQGAGQHGAQHGGAQQHAEDQHEEAYAPIFHQVNLVQLTSDGACWAAAMAMVLNSRNGSSLTVENICEQAHVDANEHKSASDVRSLGAELNLQPVNCNGSTPAGWAAALAYGCLWAPNPMNDSNVLVIAGVSGSGAEAIIHVLDPATNLDDWMNFAQFTQQYGFGDHHELLA